MKFSCLTVIVLVVMAGTGCFRSDRRTVEFSVPALTSQECLNIVSGKLRANEGVEVVEANLAAGKLSVTFNGLKLAIKNIEIIIADAGFDVNDRPADEQAKAGLPASCR